jgi:DDE family transposase
MLDDLGFARRQIATVLPGGVARDRDPPCRSIAERKAKFLAAGHPVWSIDTKKKACLGTLYRNGKVYGQPAQKAFEHDFPSWAEGVIVPHGIDDLARHHGWLPVGLSRDTTALACDSLRLYWESDGQYDDPQASELWLVCDGGGSNSCRKHLCKHDLHAVVNEVGLPIRVAHYPAYCAKFHPLERRLFCHVTRACQGVLFDS